MSTKHTSKKVKVKGFQPYVNPYSGEWIDFKVESVEERDFNFYKVWLKDYLSAQDLLGSKKNKLANWIVDNLNKENQLTYTYRQMANKTGYSLETVRVTMAILIDADFLRRINSGVYMINPDIIYKGSRTGRLHALTIYSELGKSEPEYTNDQKIEMLTTSIERMTAQLNKLKGNENHVIDFPSDSVSEDRLSN